MKRKSPVTAYIFSIVILVLAAIASSNGLLHLKIYAGNSVYLLHQIIGQDLVTLIFCVPVLLVTTIMAIRKSGRGYLAWLGTLGCVNYMYSYYIFGIAYNDYYFMYLALFSLSLFSLIRGFVALDVETISLRFSPKTSVRITGAFLVLSGLMLSVMWLERLIPAFISGKEPYLLHLYGTTTLVKQVLDLGILAPLALITGVWIWKRKPWGYVLTVILLFRELTMGLAVLATKWLSFRVEQKIEFDETIVFGGITFFTLILLIVFLKNLREEMINSYHDRISAI